MDIHTCARCKGTFWTDEMSAKREGNRIRYTYCKSCHSKRQREQYTRNPECFRKQWRDYAKKHRQNHPGSSTEKYRDEALLYPERPIARARVSRAIRSGKITKQPCEVCEDPNTLAHHDDYSKPLEVRWLCPRHHAEVHYRRSYELAKTIC